MQNLLALTSRELKSLYYSPIAYVVGAVFLIFQGVVFGLLVTVMNDLRADPRVSMAQYFFGGTFFSWFAILMMSALLTMRSFSEEKRTGSIELLLTAPVTEFQVVLAKFLSAWIAYCVLWGPTVVSFLYLRTLTTFDWGPVAAGYLGMWLLGAPLSALGVLASSLTRNQVIAAVMTFVALMLLFMVGLLTAFVRDPDTVQFIQYLSLVDQLSAFSKGIVDTRPIIFYTSVTAIGLFLTTSVVANPRWRS